MAKPLKFHDEKRFGFWGGIYEVPEPNTDEAQCIEVAAICDNPDAVRRARLFCVAEELLEAGQGLLEPLLALVEGVVPEWDEKIERLRVAVESVEAEEINNG